MIAPLDTRHPVETPEGIDLVLRPAGVAVRAVAFLLDLLIRTLLLMGFSLVLTLLGKIGAGLMAILIFALSWWYMVLFEVLNQGRSPGKQIMGLRVVHDDGTPVGWGASLLRNLLRVVDMLPFGYCLGALTCLQNSEFKRLGDLSAGTLVVYRNLPIKRPELGDVPPTLAPFRLELPEQRAVLAFAERRTQLSAARREELATIIAGPLQVRPADAAARLDSIAHGLLGPK